MRFSTVVPSKVSSTRSSPLARRLAATGRRAQRALLRRARRRWFSHRHPRRSGSPPALPARVRACTIPVLPAPDRPGDYRVHALGAAHRARAAATRASPPATTRSACPSASTWLRALDASLRQRYGHDLRGTIGLLVDCGAMAASVAHECVGPVCVGHEDDLRGVCEGALDELADQVKREVARARLQGHPFCVRYRGLHGAGLPGRRRLEGQRQPRPGRARRDREVQRRPALSAGFSLWFTRGPGRRAPRSPGAPRFRYIRAPTHGPQPFPAREARRQGRHPLLISTTPPSCARTWPSWPALRGAGRAAGARPLRDEGELGAQGARAGARRRAVDRRGQRQRGAARGRAGFAMGARAAGRDAHRRRVPRQRPPGGARARRAPERRLAGDAAASWPTPAIAARSPFRVNPGFGHGHVQSCDTGGPSSKHGVWHEDLLEARAAGADAAGLPIVALHAHVGTGPQFREFEANMRKPGRLLRRRAARLPDVDGGEPGRRHPAPLPARRRPVRPRGLPAHPARRGRRGCRASPAAPSASRSSPAAIPVAGMAMLVARVNDVKTTRTNEKGPGHNFVMVDAGFNDLIRPAMYGSYHHISSSGAGAGRAAGAVGGRRARSARAATSSPATTASCSTRAPCPARARATCWSCTTPAPTARP